MLTKLISKDACIAISAMVNSASAGQRTVVNQSTTLNREWMSVEFILASHTADVFDTATTAVNTVAVSNDKVTTIGPDGAVDGDAFMLT